ncbi:MAG: hypothetical protein M0Z30_15065 [Actinomycetota bacterium]|nr:hypothetical protein [Actinomycetota bacterium]
MGSVPPQLSLRELLPAPSEREEASVGVGVGGTYLVVELWGWGGPCWVCAPVTERALECVRGGRATPWTVLHHSATGTVDVYRTAADGSIRCSTVLCSSLPGARPARAAA